MRAPNSKPDTVTWFAVHHTADASDDAKSVGVCAQANVTQCIAGSMGGHPLGCEVQGLVDDRSNPKASVGIGLVMVVGKHLERDRAADLSLGSTPDMGMPRGAVRETSVVPRAPRSCGPLRQDHRCKCHGQTSIRLTHSKALTQSYRRRLGRALRKRREPIHLASPIADSRSSHRNCQTHSYRRSYSPRSGGHY